MKQISTCEAYIQTLQTKQVNTPKFKIDPKTKIKKSLDIIDCDKCRNYLTWKAETTCQTACHIEVVISKRLDLTSLQEQSIRSHRTIIINTFCKSVSDIKQL